MLMKKPARPSPSTFLFPSPATGYEAYLRSRFSRPKTRPTLSSEGWVFSGPDVSLVEWLIDNFQHNETPSNAKPNEEKPKTKETSVEQQEQLFGKNDEYAKGKMRKNGDNQDLMSRHMIKRNDDGRGIAFHQCYWNPVSCFRKR